MIFKEVTTCKFDTRSRGNSTLKMEAAVSSVNLKLPYTIIFLISRARWIKIRFKRGGKREYKNLWSKPDSNHVYPARIQPFYCAIPADNKVNCVTGNVNTVTCPNVCLQVQGVSVIAGLLALKQTISLLHRHRPPAVHCSARQYKYSLHNKRSRVHGRKPYFQDHRQLQWSQY